MNPHSFFDLSLWCIRFYFIIRFSLSNTPFWSCFLFYTHYLRHMYAPIFLFPVDLRKVTCSELYIYRPVLPPPLARKRQILSRRQKLMKMLVTKISKGKYRNEGQLFAEPISDSNVKLMGEMIALQALRNVMPYDFEVVSSYTTV